MDDARWIARTLVRTATALALFAALGGMSQAEDAPPLRIGMAPNYPPLAFKKNGHLQGIEVDFAKRLGGALNRKIEIIATPWEELPTALEEKKIDLVMSGTSITEARKEKFNFTDPYLTVGQMAIVRSSDYPKLRDPKAMDRPQSRVGFVSRTTGEAWARANLKKAKLHGYTNTEEGVAALEHDQIDYFIQDAPAVWRVTGGIMSEHPRLKGIYRPLTTEQLAWVVPKDNPELLAQLNKVLAEWKKDGTLDDVIDDWITVKKTSIEVKPQP
ncbi:MAG: transporter substrate-binding domain-containing protein [Candidatus Binatia bacterium]